MNQLVFMLAATVLTAAFPPVGIALWIYIAYSAWRGMEEVKEHERAAQRRVRH